MTAGSAADWRPVRLRFLFDEIDRRVGSPETDLPLLSVSIHHGVIPRSEITDREARADDFVGYKHVEPGDVVINRMRAFEGGAGISALRGIVSGDYAVLRTRNALDARFLHHLIRSRWFVGEMTARLRGIGNVELGNVRTPRINVEDLGNILVLLPPTREQRAIADYLDAETARIDALLAARQRQAASLRDHRRAVVDGLTIPGALGGFADTASPWPVTKLKRAAAFFADGDWVESPHITDVGIRLIQTGNIGEGVYRDQGFRFVSPETFRLLGCTEVLPGDILISRLAGTVGRACIAPDLGTRMIVSVDVVIMRPQPELDPRFAVPYLSSSYHLELAELLARGTTMPRLSRSQVGELPIPLPPIAEQHEIADKVSQRLSNVSEVQRAIDRQIDRLLERRQAVITAAVTGLLEIPGVAA